MTHGAQNQDPDYGQCCDNRPATTHAPIVSGLLLPGEFQTRFAVLALHWWGVLCILINTFGFSHLQPLTGCMINRLARPISAHRQRNGQLTQFRLTYRRTLSLATVTIVAAGFVLAAAPAQASTTITISGTSGNYSVTPNPLVLPSNLVEHIATITNTSDIDVRFFGASLDPTTLQVSFDSGNTYWTCFTSTACIITAGQSLPALIEIPPVNPTMTFQAGSGINDPVIAVVTLTRSGGSDPGSGSPGDQVQEPASFQQQLGLPPSGSCEDINDDAFKWGTDLTGGWGESWAQWMNDGAGGSVCTRTIEWSPGNGWRIAP
jgi:hypothetical protein